MSKPIAAYDPFSGALIAGVTPYQTFHEYAHLDQHTRRTIIWRVRETWLGIPVLGRVATLAVECEAAVIAWRDMRACGVWRAEDLRELANGLGSYLLALTILAK
jgi:hypothetical protein